MKILIELPSWLGDTVMATPAIENILKNHNDADVTFIGSSIAVEVLKNHPRVSFTHVLKKSYLNLFKTLLNFESFDLFISFRGSFRSKLFRIFVSSKEKHQFNKKKYSVGHQVEKYNNFINDSLQSKNIPGELTLYNKNENISHSNRVLGINPGASYGSAKRWDPKKYAKIAVQLSSQYNIIIFGGFKEQDIANEIEEELINNNVNNYINLANKTSIQELISQIRSLDLFITGDSGPMHIAAAYSVPTVAIFGPTNEKNTSQWRNQVGKIVKKNLTCQPCMKRKCPLRHNNCMAKIQAQDVLNAVNLLDEQHKIINS